MLTRVYFDNFRCFVNFEYKPDRQQLIMGRNGSGKSSFLDALFFLRQFSVTGAKPEDFNILGQRTRWLNQRQQTCEVEVTLDDSKYQHRLILEPYGEPPRARVALECVYLNGKPIFEFRMGEVRLYNDAFEHKVTYPFDWFRSALATITPRNENQKLTRYRQWLGDLVCFRINPFLITPRAESEDLYPRADLSNVASWYRHLVQAYPKENAAFLQSLRAVLDGFTFMELTPAQENVRLLLCEFGSNNGTIQSTKFGFGELSDGQRSLICLYMILHFVLSRGCTIIFDEPDNFVSLRELQPWLNHVSELLENNNAQIFVISHHPEFLNQWAPNHGTRFVRLAAGPVRVEEFRDIADNSLSPAQVIARGWDDD
jgi:predicted ATPase